MNEGLKALMQRKNVDTLIPETEHAGRTAEEDDWTGLDARGHGGSRLREAVARDVGLERSSRTGSSRGPSRGLREAERLVEWLEIEWEN